MLRTDEEWAELISSLEGRGVDAVSTLVIDADRLSFGGFALEDVLRRTSPPRAARRWGVPLADSLEARIDGDTVICHGTLAGGAEFGCTAEVGWLSVFGMDIEVLTSFRGQLREMVDNPLLAMREYAVIGAERAAGTTAFRFACSTIPLARLAAGG